MNIVICDDEKFFREKLQMVIEKYMSLYGISIQIQSYESGLCFLKECCIANQDVIFLDVRMQEMDGLDVAKVIRKKGLKTFIIYVSSYVEYAVSGYEVDALRYILKGDGFERSVWESLDVVMEKIRMRDQIEIFSFQGKENAIQLRDLEYVESKRHKLYFHMIEKNKIYEAYDKLDNVEGRIQEYGFIRVHQSYLVNKEYVEACERYQIKMHSGVVIPIPRAKYRAVFNKLFSFQI